MSLCLCFQSIHIEYLRTQKSSNSSKAKKKPYPASSESVSKLSHKNKDDISRRKGINKYQARIGRRKYRHISSTDAGRGHGVNSRSLNIGRAILRERVCKHSIFECFIFFNLELHLRAFVLCFSFISFCFSFSCKQCVFRLTLFDILMKTLISVKVLVKINGSF